MEAAAKKEKEEAEAQAKADADAKAKAAADAKAKADSDAEVCRWCRKVCTAFRSAAAGGWCSHAQTHTNSVCVCTNSVLTL